MISNRQTFIARDHACRLANTDACAPRQMRKSAMQQSMTVAAEVGVVSQDTNGKGNGSVVKNGAVHRVSPYDDEQLSFFRGLLLEKRAAAMEDVDRMKASLANAREHAENDTAFSLHMADAGTDAMEREKLYLLMARQQKYVGYLDRAIERVDLKTYGVCKVTKEAIPFDRLVAVPHTEICIEAKLQQPVASSAPKHLPKRTGGR